MHCTSVAVYQSQFIKGHSREHGGLQGNFAKGKPQDLISNKSDFVNSVYSLN